MHHEVPVGAHVHCSSKRHRFQSLRGALERSSLSRSLTARSNRPVSDTRMLQKMLTQSVAAGPSDLGLPNGKLPSVWHKAGGHSGKVDWQTSSSAFHFTFTYSQISNYYSCSVSVSAWSCDLTGFKALDHQSSSPPSTNNNTSASMAPSLCSAKAPRSVKVILDTSYQTWY